LKTKKRKVRKEDYIRETGNKRGYILANAGGVTVSYFEWVQNLQELLWNEEEVLERLTRIMQKSFKEVLEISLSKKIPMRTAALVLGIGRVAEATRLRGIYP